MVNNIIIFYMLCSLAVMSSCGTSSNPLQHHIEFIIDHENNIFLEQREISTDSIPLLIQEKRKTLPKEEQNNFVVQLNVHPDVLVSFVDDIKDQIMAANVSLVNYTHPHEESIIQVKLSERKQLNISIDQNNQIFINKLPVDLVEVQHAVQDFLTETSSPNYIVNLTGDTKTHYNGYLNLYNEIRRGFVEEWNRTALDKFKKTYEELMEEEDTASINELHKQWPLRIREHLAPTDQETY